MLNQCLGGIDTIKKHELQLFERGLLRLEPAADLAVLDLEKSLLSLGSLKDLSKGIFYLLAVPSDEGLITR